MITSKKEYQYARESLLRIQVMNEIDYQNIKTWGNNRVDAQMRISERLDEAEKIQVNVDALPEKTRKDFE